MPVVNSNFTKMISLLWLVEFWSQLYKANQIHPSSQREVKYWIAILLSTKKILRKPGTYLSESFSKSTLILLLRTFLPLMPTRIWWLKHIYHCMFPPDLLAVFVIFYLLIMVRFSVVCPFCPLITLYHFARGPLSYRFRGR